MSQWKDILLWGPRPCFRLGEAPLGAEEPGIPWHTSCLRASASAQFLRLVMRKAKRHIWLMAPEAEKAKTRWRSHPPSCPAPWQWLTEEGQGHSKGNSVPVRKEGIHSEPPLLQPEWLPADPASHQRALVPTKECLQIPQSMARMKCPGDTEIRLFRSGNVHQKRLIDRGREVTGNHWDWGN